MENGVRDWWDSLPIITKWLFALSMGLTLAGNFGVVDPRSIILDFHFAFSNFEVEPNVAYY